MPGSQLLQPRHLRGQNHARPLALLSGTFPRPFHIFLFPLGGSFACQPLCFSFFLSTAIEGTALRWLWAGLMVTEREGPLRLNREVEGRRWDRQGPVALGAPARQGLCSRRPGISSRGSRKQGASETRAKPASQKLADQEGRNSGCPEGSWGPALRSETGLWGEPLRPGSRAQQKATWTRISFLWGGYLGVELLGHVINVCFTFQETSVFRSGPANSTRLECLSNTKYTLVFIFQSPPFLHTEPQTTVP